MNLQIQKACKSDLTSILNLYAESDIDNGKKLYLTAAEKLFDKILSYPNFNVYVALSNDKIIGTFELLIMDNLAHMGLSSAIVEDVVVHSDYRGQGVGKKMMDQLMTPKNSTDFFKKVIR